MTDWFFSWLVRIRTILPLRPELGDLPNPQIKQIIMCFVHISVLAIFHSRPMIRVSSHFTFFSFFSVVSSQKKPPPHTSPAFPKNSLGPSTRLSVDCHEQHPPAPERMGSMERSGNVWGILGYKFWIEMMFHNFCLPTCH